MADEQSAMYEAGTMYVEVAVEFVQNGTPLSHSCRPGANVMADTMAPNSNIMAYIRRVDVEFLHDGHAEQQREQAVPVQQQASCRKNLVFSRFLNFCERSHILSALFGKSMSQRDKDVVVVGKILPDAHHWLTLSV